MLDDYYDKVRGVFGADFTHKLTGAQIIKFNIQKVNFIVAVCMLQMG
ncbi:hypothetical protein DSX90_001990 [Campylobacter jejuni]